MKIGIDARLIEETGVGRYIQNLIEQLSTIDKGNSYTVFLRRKSYDSFKLPNERWKKVLADVPWHTVTEQLIMPRILSKEHLNLVHIPYHNPSIFYPGPTIVTIHDLTILHFDTGRATTLPLPVYKLKRMGYRGVLSVGLRKAKKIIAVSKATKKEIMHHFGISEDKIVVTYEAADIVRSNGKPLIDGQYVLYVGNAYPHKNLGSLLSAWPGKIVLATPDDYFSKRLEKRKNVVMFGSANKEQLANLYTHAGALVFPSLMEGFGLPGLEAMTVGTPVVCSDIPVFREIYGDACLTFNPNNSKDIVQKIQEVLTDEKLRRDLIAKGKIQAAKYSWRKMAEETLNVYEHSIRV